MAATKTRIANNKVILHRAGKRITINAGERFDFTQDELDSIAEVNPDAVRKLVDESESAPEAKVPAGKARNLTAQANAEVQAKNDAKNGGKGGADKSASDNKSEDL